MSVHQMTCHYSERILCSLKSAIFLFYYVSSAIFLFYYVSCVYYIRVCELYLAVYAHTVEVKNYNSILCAVRFLQASTCVLYYGYSHWNLYIFNSGLATAVARIVHRKTHKQKYGAMEKSVVCTIFGAEATVIAWIVYEKYSRNRGRREVGGNIRE